MDDLILANRLAALATVLDDALAAGIEDLSPSAIAALQIVRQSEPVSIGRIATGVGLTHSATVRLVDRLEKEWLVRRLARKSREVMVVTTTRGKRRATELAKRRIEAAGVLLTVLSPAERAVLASAIDRMLTVPIDGSATAERVCRLCFREPCREAGCPVEAAGQRMDERHAAQEHESRGA
jgi:DNA-binding MarR family transcriptional regulator